MVLYTDCIQQCSRPMYMVGDSSPSTSQQFLTSSGNVQRKEVGLFEKVMVLASLVLLPPKWLGKCRFTPNLQASLDLSRGE